MVEREYAELVERYGFHPEGPLTIELYANPEHYAVRTVGLPGLEALGVTFGKVVTGMSPMGGRFNWGMMLWHEVAHVFSIQLSRSRVPRWFTEGLSEYETARLDPTWTRRTHAELYHAARGKAPPSVAELNLGFTRARDVAHMVVAYHQAAEVVSFLVARFGFPVVPRALALFAAGKETAEVIPAITGMTAQGLRRGVRGRAAAAVGAVPAQLLRPPERLLRRRSAARAPRRASARRARQGAVGAGALEGAKGRGGAAADRQGGRVGRGGRAGDGANPPDGRAAARGRTARGRAQGAPDGEKLFNRLVESQHDGYDARLWLGKIAVEENDLVEAKRQLALAKSFDPESAEPYLLLAKALMKTDEEATLHELEKAAELEVMDGSIPKALVELYGKRQRWADVVRTARLSQLIDPYDVDVHTQLARALSALARPGEARVEIELALKCAPSAEQRALLQKLRATVTPAPPPPSAR